MAILLLFAFGFAHPLVHSVIFVVPVPCFSVFVFFFLILLFFFLLFFVRGVPVDPYFTFLFVSIFFSQHPF